MALVAVDGYTGRVNIFVDGKRFIPILPRQQQWE